MITKRSSTLLFSLLLGVHGGAALAQSPASAFDPGNSRQSWQDLPGSSVLAQCDPAPPAFRIGGNNQNVPAEPPPPPELPVSEAIPGIVAGGQQWQLVWAWSGNNADGPIAGEGGTLLFANNDASNVMRMDPATGLAEIIHDDVNTGGAVSRSKNGNLYVAMRGLNSGILQLEPTRRVFADTFNGQPFDCVGGVVNDITADSRGGVYVSVSGRGLFYADPDGNFTEYGTNVQGANGIILSPEEDVLYLTNGPVLMAYDVNADGSLSNERQFAELRSGGGDGSTVDAEGRIYVNAGPSVDIFAPDGEYLGTIPGPQGLHGVAFGGEDKRTLYGIVFYGGWGTVHARNQIVAMPMLSQGYTGRAK